MLKFTSLFFFPTALSLQTGMIILKVYHLKKLKEQSQKCLLQSVA